MTEIRDNIYDALKDVRINIFQPDEIWRDIRRVILIDIHHEVKNEVCNEVCNTIWDEMVNINMSSTLDIKYTKHL